MSRSVAPIRVRALRIRHGFQYGRALRERARFVLHEARNVWCTVEYRLRDSGLSVYIRHHPSPHGTPSVDTWVLREIFIDGAYSIPSAAKLPSAPHVVDLGANTGLFAAFLLSRYPAAQITAFEPDRDNARLLREMVRRNGCGTRFVLHEACAMPADGPVRFATGEHQFSHVAREGERDAGVEVPGIDVFPYLDDVDLLKMDIEGGEWALLQDQRFGSSHAVVMEYHPMMCPTDDPRSTAKRLLEDHGYEIVVDDEPMLWALRR